MMGKATGVTCTPLPSAPSFPWLSAVLSGLIWSPGDPANVPSAVGTFPKASMLLRPCNGSSIFPLPMLHVCFCLHLHSRQQRIHCKASSARYTKFH